MTSIIELNDLEVSLYHGSERLYQQPGYAIVREGDMLFGNAARRLARVHPQQANQQYFARMNADPLPQPIQTAANHADLVYSHLRELAEVCADDAVLAVPGTMNGDQLGILLGICQEAGIEVSGFVNAAVAAVATTTVAEKILYLDVFLQHTQVSELNVGEEVRHERSFEVRECSFSGLVEGWVNLIADRFVHETRFDPLHTAASEQQLYNQVYDWVIGAHYQSEVAIEVLHGEQRRRVEVPRTQLEQKAQQRIDRLIDALAGPNSLVLSARAARLPGLTARLKTAGYEINLLAADAVATGCNENLDRVRTIDAGLRLVTRLPNEHETATSAVRGTLNPTHLLADHVAQPIGTTLAVREDSEGLWLAPGNALQINGETLVADRRLCLGDLIRIGSRTFTAIRLEA